ncbi:hypothetical protein [Bradyrhizobium sp.]|uniref:hypothetical protein n=1 Tax=Bradyrhizobium sp. TaxID=376 RepID=UPI001DAD0883|nr:hypothetical protein [Bradyrhizobium sp.]MBV8696612.1 hypothetical protein [Bradyrhizobium sp.]MBV8921025.1 hypothetical protein [Bradyrhizobium sp.]MBV9981227.1 hypothetical protein [Bradyrhizobium sp.]
MRLLRIVPIAIALLPTAVGAFPGERDRLNACQALVDLTTRAPHAGPAHNAADDAELQKCRMVIKEWTLRDSRMSVDEQGRPLH